MSPATPRSAAPGTPRSAAARAHSGPILLLGVLVAVLFGTGMLISANSLGIVELDAISGALRVAYGRGDPSGGPALPASPVSRRAGKVLWTTLLEKETDPQVFKRHLITKHAQGVVPCESMVVFAMPGAKSDLVSWANILDVDVRQVSTYHPGLHSWCLTDFEQVVFMVPNTLIQRDVRGLANLCAGEAPLCGASAGFDLPNYYIDAGVIVARPNQTHCVALQKMAQKVSGMLHSSHVKAILNAYFGASERTVIDPRYNVLAGESHSVHKLEDAIVVQDVRPPSPSPSRRSRNRHHSSSQPIEISLGIERLNDRADRTLGVYEARLKDAVPKSVLYVTMLTPTPEGMFTHSTTLELLKEHHYSKYYFGKIPWENQGIVYTENAFPEYRAWLKAKGGQVIEVPPLFCEGGRDARYKYQYTKLQFWNLTAYDYIVYTDLDSYITGDISKLWTSCVDDVPVCGVEESMWLPVGHYMNAGLLVARPSAETYRLLIEGRKTYDKRQWLCEQDYLNFFLTRPRLGVVDPKYNVMTFEGRRIIRVSESKVVHFRWDDLNNLRGPNNEEDRDFMHNFKNRLDAIIYANE